MHEVLDVCALGSIEQRARPVDVHVRGGMEQVAKREAAPLGRRRVGCGVDNRVDVGNRLSNAVAGCQIPFDLLDLGAASRLSSEDPDQNALADQARDDLLPEMTCSSGYEDSHWTVRSVSRFVLLLTKTRQPSRL